MPCATGRPLSSALFCLCLMCFAVRVSAQNPASSTDSLSHMFRFYEDDDFINIWFDGTDDAYTNGTRIDYFYRAAHPRRFFLNRWMPGAGDSSVDVYGWGAMQVMYTPDDISSPAYQPNDYPWSGGLIGIHSRYSYNPKKHYDIQTEVVLGVMGPAAMDRLTQSLTHSIIDYYSPAGWAHQFSNALLLNVNFTVEKQLASFGSVVNIIGGSQLYTGTMQNGAALYPMLIIGKMNPYFDGFFGQYSSMGGDNNHPRWQIYFFAKPELQLFLSNALLQGGIFTTNPNIHELSDTTLPSYHALQNWVPSFTYGMNTSYGHWGFSFSQIISAATLRNLYCHNYGNISLFYSW
jgi:lipid A 3-O-deacylase